MAEILAYCKAEMGVEDTFVNTMGVIRNLAYRSPNFTKEEMAAILESFKSLVDEKRHKGENLTIQQWHQNHYLASRLRTMQILIASSEDLKTLRNNCKKVGAEMTHLTLRLKGLKRRLEAAKESADSSVRHQNVKRCLRLEIGFKERKKEQLQQHAVNMRQALNDYKETYNSHLTDFY